MTSSIPQNRRARFARLALLVCAACFAPWAAAQAPAPSTAPPEHPAPGLTYRHIVRKSPAGEPWSIHILEIDRREKKIALRAAEGRDAQGQMQRESPTEMAARAVREGADVVAIVNADFDLGAPYFGIPDGLALSAGQLWTTGKPDWPEMGMLRSGEPVIGLPSVAMEIIVGNRRWQVATLNKPLGFATGDAPRLYTRAFRASLKHEKVFRALVIGKLSRSLPLPGDGAIRGEVVQTLDPTNEVAIPPDGLVLAFPPAKPPAAGTAGPMMMVALPQPGEKVTLRIRAGIAGRAPVQNAVGGSHIIVHQGKRIIEGPHSDNLLLPHPRTAACYNAREWIFVVVDGRQPQLSVGMTLDELGELMVSLGCKEAINLDGGGSSMMAIAFSASDPKSARVQLRIVNSPSDGKERGRGNAWLVVRKN
jgi:hypothetical protein